ncbi:MAG: RsmE family RNA methyltransferase [Spirochaetales bacterium]
MKQLLLPATLSAGQRYSLTGGDSHYLARVLRVQPGARLTVMDAAGDRHTVEVEAVDSTGVTLRQLDRLVASLENVAIRVFQAVPKGRKFDEVVRSLTQLGVRSITPVISERSVADPTEKAEAKTARWNRVAREAIQQSGASHVTVEAPVRLDEVDFDREEGLSLLLHPVPLAHETLHAYLNDAPSEISLWVGPEGGFADNEVEWLQERGIRPLWLGPRVLRSELAAVVAASAIQTLLLEQVAWRLTTEQDS